MLVGVCLFVFTPVEKPEGLQLRWEGRWTNLAEKSCVCVFHDVFLQVRRMDPSRPWLKHRTKVGRCPVLEIVLVFFEVVKRIALKGQGRRMVIHAHQENP